MQTKVYVEGGGSPAGRDSVRDAFNSLLRRFVTNKQGLTVVACGGKSETIKAFLDGCDAEPNHFNVLLVDSDGHATDAPIDNLRGQGETARLAKTDPLRLHRMVRAMEAWVVADPDGLRRVYRGAFHAGKLPSKTADIEAIDSRELKIMLWEATEHSDRGPYDSVDDIEEIFETVDVHIIRKRCRHFDALCSLLEGLAKGEA